MPENNNANRSRSKRNRYGKNLPHGCGSGTKSYHRNKLLIESGETFRSGRRRGPEKSPSRSRSRF